MSFSFRLCVLGSLASLLSMSSLAHAQNVIVLSLEQAMDMAEGYSFSARISAQNEIVADEQESAQFRQLFPEVSASGQYYLYNKDVNKAVGNENGILFGVPSSSNADYAVGSLTLTQPIIGIIPLLISINQYSAQLRAATHTKEQSQNDARFAGAKAYINAEKSAQLLEVAAFSVDVAEKQLHDAEAQYNAGKLTNADTLKFKLDLENAKTTLIQAQTTYRVALLTLGENIGIRDLQSFTLPKKYESIWEKKQRTTASLANAVQEGLQKRSDLVSAREQAEAVSYAKLYALSAYFPSLNLVSQYQRNFLETGGYGFTASDVRDTWFYGLQLNWELLDWGVRQAQYNEAVAKEHASRLQVESLESQIRIESIQGNLQLQDAVQVLGSAKASVQYAEDAYAQTNAQFINGQVTSTDLIISSNDQATARANLANAIGDLDLAWLTYQRAIGARLTTLD